MKYRNYILSIMLAAAVFAIQPVKAFADEFKIGVTTEEAIKENLEKLVGKSVILILKSGTEVSGKVAVVGPKSLHLSQIAGKDFYDAVIQLDDISAMMVKVRG